MKKKRQTVYKDKTVQGTYFTTVEAAKKLKAAQVRAGRPGRKVTASDVITFCLLRAADDMTLLNTGL